MRFNLVLLLCFWALSAAAQYNLDFEEITPAGQPAGWHLPSKRIQTFFHFTMDSTAVQQGHYALKISAQASESYPAAVTDWLPVPVTGRRIRLAGYIRTRGLTKGNALLSMRLLDKNDVIISSTDLDEQVTGTTDWKKVSVGLDCQPKAAKLVISAASSGRGEVWIDNLQVSIDDKPVGSVAVKPIVSGDPVTNRNLEVANAALTGDLSPEKIGQLADLCQIWGFLKYYHPAIATGQYDWDSTLFSLIPVVMKASPQDAWAAEESLIDQLGAVPVCRSCAKLDTNRLVSAPDYAGLFDAQRLLPSLQNKLAFIRDNHAEEKDLYYVRFEKVGNILIDHEVIYDNTPYPLAAVRLLALFRYWNTVLYWFPDRYLMQEDWRKVLVEFIPRFIHDADRREYLLTSIELTGHIHDTHAMLMAEGTDSLRGMLMTPFQAKFVEGKLVVTGYYVDSPAVKDAVQPGDIIQTMDGTPVDSLVKKFLPLTSASNYITQLRNLQTSSGFLLRSDKSTVELTIQRGNTLRQVSLQRLPYAKIAPHTVIDYANEVTGPGFRLLGEDIGYINAGRLGPYSLDSIRTAFKNTRGIIIDIRNYPTTVMPFTYGKWLKTKLTPFARFTQASLQRPGAFYYTRYLASNGGGSSSEVYTGKLIIIVNSLAQSQAEFTAMALHSVPGAVVVGSQTAGADGNVSWFNLPGGVRTLFSGLGVYYPDGVSAQRAGVRIDVPVEPTIKGITEGRDEYLERAIRLIH